MLGYPGFINPGDNAWQLFSAILVGLMSVPGLAILYGGVVKKKWAINSAMMCFYAFAMVLLVWMLWGYNMSFGNPLGNPKLIPAANFHSYLVGILHNLVGIPGPALSAAAEQSQAVIPMLAGGMPAMHFPMATLVFFQFVFAAITPVILAGGVLGRMNFKAWMLFVPIWATLVYSVNAFMIWGGGWLAQLGAVDYSGGYVIHVAGGVAGFVAAAFVGPRLLKDREHFPPNNLLMAMAGAGILWLGWNGFNGGDPFFAGADAASAVLNTDIATATALISWLFLDTFTFKKPSLVGSINGMITGLVAITPAAGYVNGWGAIIIGIVASVIPWITMNKVMIFRKVDDTLGVIHTHAIAGAIGGLMTGLLADPNVIVYPGSGKVAGFAVTGLFYGNPHQFVVQLEALLVVVAFTTVATIAILKLISFVVPLRADEAMLLKGDLAFHGEEAYSVQEPPYFAPPTVHAMIGGPELSQLSLNKE